MAGPSTPTVSTPVGPVLLPPCDSYMTVGSRPRSRARIAALSLTGSSRSRVPHDPVESEAALVAA